ncbi:MAG: branched-chain amino acid transport system substrate-binding protein [Micromonosporaceae bacterium]|nr:branched-chain amino acid transport system substrate-binding protein [Micromonosporaceae bacterium]
MSELDRRRALDRRPVLDRRQALRLLAAFGAGGVAASGLSACSTGSRSPAVESRSPIKVGLVAPRSGINKMIGDELINGFQLYLALHDDTLGGRRVILVTADEGGTAESGRAAVEKLIKQDRVTILTGIAGSATMDAVREVVESSQIPLIGSNASPTTLQGVRYIWRTSYVDDEPAKALGRYVSDKMRGGGVVALIAPADQSGRDAIEGFRATFGRSVGSEPVYTPVSSAPGSDFQPYLESIRRSNATAVFAFYSGGQAVEFVKQYRLFGVGQDLYAPAFLTEGVLLRDEGDNARGIYTSVNYSPDAANEANRRFATAYQKTYNAIPTTYAVAAYDAGLVLDMAIGAAGGGEPSPQAINLAMGTLGSIDSPRGSWQFNQNRTPLQTWYLRQVRPDGGVLANVVLTELTTLG